MNRIIAAFSRKQTVDPQPAIEDPSFEDPFPGPGPGEVICYYGCPNSKKAQKLQLNKKAYR